MSDKTLSIRDVDSNELIKNFDNYKDISEGVAPGTVCIQTENANYVLKMRDNYIIEIPQTK